MDSVEDVREFGAKSAGDALRGVVPGRRVLVSVGGGGEERIRDSSFLIQGGCGVGRKRRNKYPRRDQRIVKIRQRRPADDGVGGWEGILMWTREETHPILLPVNRSRRGRQRTRKTEKYYL